MATSAGGVGFKVNPEILFCSALRSLAFFCILFPPQGDNDHSLDHISRVVLPSGRHARHLLPQAVLPSRRMGHRIPTFSSPYFRSHERSSAELQRYNYSDLGSQKSRKKESCDWTGGGIRAHKKSQISFGLLWLRRRVMRTLFQCNRNSLTNTQSSRHIAKFLMALQHV
jgi:hypothetical protein